MRGSEHPVVMQILQSLNEGWLEEDEQMALLLQQLEVLEDKALPIAEIAAFLLKPIEGQAGIWLLEEDHIFTWDIGVALLERDPGRIPVASVVEALAYAYERSDPEDAWDSDDDSYLAYVIHLAGIVGTRFPAEALLPLLSDERIIIRRLVIDALVHMQVGGVLAALLADPSAQIRVAVLDHLAERHQLTLTQAQTLAIDPHPRVRAAALAWLTDNQAIPVKR